MCHAVEIEHSGTQDASVVYIAATPTTERNLEYMRDQAARFREGRPPRDFEMSDYLEERKMVRFPGEEAFKTEEARRAFCLV